MKRICTLLFFVFLLQHAYAGGYSGGRYTTSIKDKKFTFGFKFGAAFPLGDFGRKDSLPKSDSTHNYGFANTGFQFEIGLTYRFAKNIGVAASMFNSICPFDAGTYASVYNYSPSLYTVKASGNHFIAQYLAGPYFFFPASDNFAFEGKILVGILTSRYPDFTIASTIPGNYYSETVSHAQASGFGYTFSFGGHLKVGDYLGITAAVTYSGADVRYSGIFYTYSTPSGALYGTISDSDRHMSLGIIGLTVGFGLSF